MDLKTLADVRDFLEHIPKERRQNHTSQVGGSPPRRCSRRRQR
jgi:hypothetical protein